MGCCISTMPAISTSPQVDLGYLVGMVSSRQAGHSQCAQCSELVWYNVAGSDPAGLHSAYLLSPVNGDLLVVARMIARMHENAANFVRDFVCDPGPSQVGLVSYRRIFDLPVLLLTLAVTLVMYSVFVVVAVLM